MSFGATSGVTYIIFLISDGVTDIKEPGVRTGTAFLPAQYKDPINMIMSYPPKIR